MPRYVILQYYTCHRREGIANVSRMCRTLRALCKYILHGAKYQKQCMISTPARASPIRRILHRMFRKSFFPSRLPGEQLVKNEGYLGGHRCRAGRIHTEEKKQSALDLCGSAMMDKWRAWDDKMLNECSFSNLGKSTTIQDSFSDELGCQVEHKLCPGVATRLYCQPDSA